MDNEFTDSSINVDFFTLQYLYKYVQYRQPVLRKRIASSTRIIHKMKMRKRDNNREIYPECVVEKDEDAYLSKQQMMQREEIVLNEFCHKLDKIINKGGCPNLQLLVQLSNYVFNRIEILEQQYDIDLREIVQLKRHHKVIEAALSPFLPHTKIGELPIILIDADYNNDTTVYVKIYDYLCNTLKLVENDMKILITCILAYKQCFDNIHEGELFRWEKPHLVLHHERNNLIEMITYFKYVFSSKPNPTAKDMMKGKNFATVSFFKTLDTYLTEKLNTLLNNKVKEQNEINAYNPQKVTLMEKQIDTLREYTEETGPAYEEVMNVKRVNLDHNQIKV